jgi:hypothetical protein
VPFCLCAPPMQMHAYGSMGVMDNMVSSRHVHAYACLIWLLLLLPLASTTPRFRKGVLLFECY